jgi:tetratricopeptide (TPR) repeat protein
MLSYSLLATWQRNWDYENEITLWQASVRQAPNHPRAWNNLGYAYKLDKQNEKAITAFENALKLDSSNYKAFYNLQQLK